MESEQKVSGSFTASKIVMKILEKAESFHLEDLEGLCLRSLGTQKVLNLNRNKLDPSLQRKSLISSFLSVGFNSSSNHSIRFRNEKGDPNAAYSSRGSIFQSNSVNNRDYENVILPEILSAPITDICVIQRGDAVPTGFYKISLTPSGKKANLNTGSGGNALFLCFKKDPTRETSPITALVVIFPDRGEFILPGFFAVRRSGTACNINAGTASERVFLCYKKEKCGNPIYDIQPFFANRADDVPNKGFLIIEKSPRNIEADLNVGTGGAKIFLSYRQTLSKLQCLATSSSRYTLGGRHHVAASSSLSLSGMHLEYAPPGQDRSNERASADSLHRRNKSVNDIRLKTKKSHSFPDKSTTTDNAIDKSHELRSGSEAKLDSESSVAQEVAIGDDAFLDPLDTEPELEEDGDEDAIDVQHDDTERFQTILRRFDMKYSEPVLKFDGTIVSEESRKLLHPILAALYVRQGAVYDLAIASLQTLVEDTDFFDDELSNLGPTLNLSLLDIAIDAVCDRFDCYVDAELDPLLHFLQSVLRRSKGVLSLHSLKCIFRTTTLVCACHATESAWLLPEVPMPCQSDGSPLLAFKVLLQLLHSLLERAETVTVENELPKRMSQYSPEECAYQTPVESLSKLIFPESEADAIAHAILREFVDDVIDSVETARLAERTLILVAKATSHTSSSSFWLDLFFLSQSLFRSYELQSTFVIIAALCKVSLLEIRTCSLGLLPRDLGNKLFALDAVRELCSSAGEKVRQSKVMGYVIRRLVFPAVIASIVHALKEVKIFSIIMKTLTALWRNWREHIRMEFAIVCEQFVIRMLHASASRMMYLHQLAVLEEVISWFELPQLLVEMFVNFDIDRNLVAHWNVFTNLTRAVCTLSTRAVHHEHARNISSVRLENNHGYVPGSGQGPVDPVHEVTMKALGVVAQIAKALMDATGHAHLIVQDIKTRSRSLMVGGGWETNEEWEDAGDATDSSNGAEKPPLPPRTPMIGKIKQNQSVKKNRARNEESAQLLQQAIKIYHEKDSLIKAVKFLVSKNFMSDTPQEVASFLRLYRSNFDPVSIGELLGEGGKNREEEIYWEHVRYRYTRAVSFADMSLGQSLRKYLTQCGFRMPGEAQKINRFVEAFVKVFWQDNKDTPFAPFKHEDTVHIVVYAIIMLNTDLHRQHGKKTRRMTKEEFINNLRGSDIDKNNKDDKGSNINREYLSAIYDDILDRPIEMAVDAFETEKEDAADNNFDRLTFSQNILKALRNAEDLLRSMAPFTHRFMVTGVDINISLDMVSFMFENVWHHFFSLTEALLGSVRTNISVTFLGLDILKYALTSCIFLDLKVERLAFATLLEKFYNMFEGQRTNAALVSASTKDSHFRRVSAGIRPTPTSSPDISKGNNPPSPWFKIIETANPENAMAVSAEVHSVMEELKHKLTDFAQFEEVKVVASRIERKANIIESNTYFVREGDLAKMSKRGKLVTYRFFLFSDTLLYCHHGISEYKVHSQLSLAQMTIHEVDDPRNNSCSFYISHPTKSFVACADSFALKSSWMRDLQETIAVCKSKRRSLTIDTSKLNEDHSTIFRVDTHLSNAAESPTASDAGDMISSCGSTTPIASGARLAFDFPSSTQQLLSIEEEDADSLMRSRSVSNSMIPSNSTSARTEASAGVDALPRLNGISSGPGLGSGPGLPRSTNDSSLNSSSENLSESARQMEVRAEQNPSRRALPSALLNDIQSQASAVPRLASPKEVRWAPSVLDGASALKPSNADDESYETFLIVEDTSSKPFERKESIRFSVSDETLLLPAGRPSIVQACPFSRSDDSDDEFEETEHNIPVEQNSPAVDAEAQNDLSSATADETESMKLFRADLEEASEKQLSKLFVGVSVCNNYYC